MCGGKCLFIHLFIVCAPFLKGDREFLQVGQEFFGEGVVHFDIIFLRQRPEQTGGSGSISWRPGA